MSETGWPWERYGGSFVWLDKTERPVTVPAYCCATPKPVLIGDCGRGCCDDYECANCHRQWRYEWPD